jgi:hypothetical protein
MQNSHLPISGVGLPFQVIFHHEVSVCIFWPNSHEHDGHTFHYIGNQTIHTETNMPSAEYALVHPGASRRIWLRCDGLVTEG